MSMRTFKHLTKADRIKLETLLNAGHSKKEIANILHVHISTIYREIKRGEFEALNTTLEKEKRYSCDMAEKKYRENLKAKGPELKIGKDLELASYIENKIVRDGYSPEAVIGEIKETGKEFKTEICVTTLYSYIDKGIFLKVTNKSLSVKGKRKREYSRVKRYQKRTGIGESIEKRPEKIDSREDFGHWEMDTVKGKRGKSKNVMLVLTERKTRNELIYKMPDGKTESVIRVLNRLERKWGKKFQDVFKTITVDNGAEFSDCEGMEHSVIKNGSRTKIYYCHPYSSWERGSNEVANKMIRRKIPKGENFDAKTQKEIKDIENWINDYPRRIFGYKTARQMFEQELEVLE